MRAQGHVAGNPPAQHKAHSQITVLLIEDHNVVRTALAQLLSLEPDIHVIGQADNGSDGIALWRRHSPDVGIVDLRMAGMDGLETIKRIRALDPRARLVVLTSAADPADADRAEAAGAAAYLTKHVAQDDILDVIRQVHAGRAGVRRGVCATAGPIVTLSPRELVVLQHLRRGESNACIGRRLGITEGTVKCHVNQILLKLKATDRAGAVARGFDLGLLRAVTDPA